MLSAALLVLAFPPAADGWEPLIPGEPAVWRKVDAKWLYAADAALDPANPRRLKPVGSGSNVWVNGETGRVADLYTAKSYGDCEVRVEFLMGKGSNSGIKFHGVYEIQLRDSADKKGKLTGDDCGGIYPIGSDLFGYRQVDDGVPPRVNAAKPAGEWQSLVVEFRAARFDAAGKKTQRAAIVKATLNGQLIHDNQEMKHPTGTNWEAPEKPTGPFMLQADHGPVAFRNVSIRGK